MKKTNKPQPPDDDMLPEYDFKGKKGMRGKYYAGQDQTHEVHIYHADGTVTKQHFSSVQKVILLDADVAAHFPDSESVNHTLRTLIALVPEKQIGEKKAKYQAADRVVLPAKRRR
ncbi:hypothetical protein FBQ81_18780 [Chloroflexi bacterium CFX6]|nr:hypothetical protein [Chloroflexi bacterium CFX6]